VLGSRRSGAATKDSVFKGFDGTTGPMVAAPATAMNMHFTTGAAALAP
jgi:hypothetical protein